MNFKFYCTFEERIYHEFKYPKIKIYQFKIYVMKSEKFIFKKLSVMKRFIVFASEAEPSVAISKQDWDRHVILWYNSR